MVSVWELTHLCREVLDTEDEMLVISVMGEMLEFFNLTGVLKGRYTFYVK